MVEGTAVALHLGHRRSIDYDLFTLQELNNQDIKNTIRKEHPIQQSLVEKPNKLSIVANNVKITFLKYPFKIKPEKNSKTLFLFPVFLPWLQ